MGDKTNADKAKCERTQLIDQADNFIENLRVESRPDPGYGLCATCKEFLLTKTLYGREMAECNSFKVSSMMKPNRIDPVIKCSGYWKQGWMNIRDAVKIATIIQVKKCKTGFMK